MKDCAPDAAADISVKMTKMIMNDKSNNALLENKLLADCAHVWTFDNTVFDFVSTPHTLLRPAESCLSN